MNTQAFRTLLVEDGKAVRELVASSLRREGLVTELAEDGESALEKIRHARYDLLVIDWMLPGLSGLELIKIVRNELKRMTPILMITAKRTAAETIEAIEAGADNFVSKPFEIPVLIAQVRALLRRSAMPGSSAGEGALERIRIGELTIDPIGILVLCGAERVPLTDSEFRIVMSLARNRGRVLSRNQLIQAVKIWAP